MDHGGQNVSANHYGPSGDYVGYPAVRVPQDVRATAIAFYTLPSNDMGPDDPSGWTRVAIAASLRDGGAQAHLPGALGWYDPACPDTIQRQSELAARHGIGAFCFQVTGAGDLAAVPITALRRMAHPPLDYCFIWSPASGMGDIDADSRAVEARTFLAAAMDCLRDRHYLRIDGRPLLLVEHHDRWPDAGHLLEGWRKTCAEAGLPSPFVVAVSPVVDSCSSGFDAVLAPQSKTLSRGKSASTRDDSNVDVSAHEQQADTPGSAAHPQFRCVQSGFEAMPADYGVRLRAAVAFAEANPVADARLVFVRAWNDWVGGDCLEPDIRHGHALLHETRNALARSSSRPGIALMVHDAQPHGAQYLALHLLEEFRRLDVQVEVLLLGAGVLDARFEALAPVHHLYRMTTEAQAVLAAAMSARGISAVIANTTVCGRNIAPFHAVGLRVVSLIHELPGVIAAYGLQDALSTLLSVSDKVVISSRPVREHLLATSPGGDLENRLVFLPQGLYKRNRHAGARDMVDARVRLRDRFGLAHHVAVVVAVGYADRRKGVDLLARAAVRACASRADLNIVWVGERDAAFCSQVDALLRKEGLESRFHFAGFDYDTDDHYAGADVYALVSREDPLPSVVLESLSVGTPVVAFSGTGGAADLVDGRAGFVVPAFDVDAYATALLQVVNDPALRDSLGAAGREIVERDFRFRHYVLELLALAGDESPRVSVVVPNRDYAHYLPERIDSIAAQTLPVAEIVVLDDASTDNSLDILRLQSSYIHPLPTIVRSSRNSGSVFRQWLAGVRRASSEYVWIAEADDVADRGLIEALITPMREDGRIVMAYAQSSRIDAAGRVIAPDYLGYTDDLDRERWRAAYTATGEEEVAAGLGVKNTIPNVSAALFRREPLLQVLERNMDELAGYRVAGDWVVYLHLLQLGRIHFVPGVLNHHRFHAASATARLDPQRHFDEVVAVQALAARIYRTDARVQHMASDYARRLRAHFGLTAPWLRGEAKG